MIKFDPNSPTRYRIEKMFWYGNLPVATGLLIFDNALWQSVSIFYLAILSIWALASTADGNEEAAKARELGEAVNDATNAHK